MVDLGMREDQVIPILDIDFEVVRLDDNPIWSAKIGFGFPFEVRNALIECLWANADLFIISPYEFPIIEPIAAFHG